MLKKIRERFKVNIEAFKDDLRKIGVSMIIAGMVGALVIDDKITAREAAIIALIGVLFWLTGIVEKEGGNSGD